MFRDGLWSAVRSTFLPCQSNTGFHPVAQDVSLEFCEHSEHTDSAGNIPFFKQTGCGSVRFHVRGVNHQSGRIAGFPGQLFENSVEHAHPAPADKTVVQRFMRAVFARCVFPSQAILDHRK